MSTTECDSGDWSAEFKQEILPVVKQGPEDVCCIVCYMYESMCVGEFLTYITYICSLLTAQLRP